MNAHHAVAADGKAASMVVTHHATAAALLAHAGAFLESSEAENGLILGICATPAPPDPGALWVSVDSESGCVAVAIRTPPFNLVLSGAPDLALAALVDALAAREVVLPGVIGPAAAARAFAELWSGACRVRAEATMGQAIYELTRVVPPSPCAPGALRAARARDLDRVTGWIEGFASDAKLPVAQHEALRRRARTLEGVFLWEEASEAVSMATLTGPTPHGIRVSGVYTPPPLRGRGYASACVAALSARALAEGRRFCTLNTDLANPISNSIYRRIGYERVGESAMIAFHPEAPPVEGT